MPWAMNDGVRRHYEVASEKPPLVLHVGFMGSLEAGACRGRATSMP